MGKLASILGVMTVLVGSTTVFGATVIDYEDWPEGDFFQFTHTHQGVTYHDINNVSGHFPSGETFGPEPDYNQYVGVEDATNFYNDFPRYGSPVNAMTLGGFHMPGPNLTLGALASVWMDLDQLHNAASIDIGYYENGPWGGIEYRLDALLGDSVVASDYFVISDLGGRDNPTYSTLSVSGAEFDQLHLYAWYDGMYSKPRGLFDDLTLTAVPEPASLLLLGIGAMVIRRR